MPVTIRSRLLLLVLSVLLPALLGVAWLIQQTFQNERLANERLLRETARALSLVIDRELTQRDTVARVLAQSRWLDDAPALTPAQLALFEQQARRSLAGLDGWIELHDTGRVLLDSRLLPGVTPATAPAGTDVADPLPRLFDQPRVQPLRRDDDKSEYHAALLYPVERGGRTLLNVVVTLRPLEMQRIVDQQRLPEGWIGAVIDSQGLVVARQPGGAAMTGRMVTADLRQRLATQSDGLFESVSLDGVRATGFFSRSRQGWVYVSAMPRAEFAGRLPQAVRRIGLGAAVLLALAVGGALWLSRRIVRPVLALKHAAQQMQGGRPVPFRATGIVECDEVARSLAEAAEAIRHGRDDLERQVAAAVDRTRLAEQRVSQSQRVEALGRLTGGVAHDFNNLLGVISNSAHLMQRHATPEMQAPLAATLRSVEVGSRLTQHLLRVAGRRPVRPQRLALARVLPEMQEVLKTVLGQRIEVGVKVAADIAPVTLDAGELELALINLALNARDAMPRGGSVRVRGRNAGPDDTEGLPPGRYVLITVADDGMGIESDLAERVFEPFFTTKETGKGTGLGLAQVHGFCVQAGGTARLASTSGVGTTVSLLLPAAADEPPAAAGPDPVPTSHHAPASRPAAAAPAAAGAAPPAAAQPGPLRAGSGGNPPAALGVPPAPLDGATVLLVEDNGELAEVTAALLQASGARVLAAPDAVSALERLAAGAQPDVVLSDVVMPGGMDGLALARHLRRERPGLPVVLISGYNSAVEAAREFTLLRKPCTPEDLLAALQAALGPASRQRPQPLG